MCWNFDSNCIKPTYQFAESSYYADEHSTALHLLIFDGFLSVFCHSWHIHPLHVLLSVYLSISIVLERL